MKFCLKLWSYIRVNSYNTFILQAHCRAFVINTYVKTLETANVSLELMSVLIELGELICAHWILNHLGDFLLVNTYFNFI